MEIRKEAIIHSYDGVELYYQQDVPSDPKAIVVIVHGLGEHSGRYDYVVKALNSYGYGVFRFDNRGHGKSGGARGYLDDYFKFVDDANFIVDNAKEQFPDVPIFMLGHSMGGFITASYGVKYPKKLNGQILSGPCIIELPIFEDLKTVDVEKNPLSPIENGLSHLVCRSQKVVDDYNNDPFNLKVFTLKLLTTVFHDGIQWLTSNVTNYHYPCLILHGEDDQIVPKNGSEYLYHNSPSNDKMLKVYPDLYHEILNEEIEKKEIMEEINSWIKKRI
ncbi:alpha/beta hydrolase [Pseudalkalibacillus decolorationis]|uniref:alpha/beta hydrolase n=1 Tax=Pseudalkalibacillus decolorationis TaxID=163879 RepID=UPI0021474796|nr:alpha/beta hydrolase [Pseudalkalibacillus decolorationis]